MLSWCHCVPGCSTSATTHWHSRLLKDLKKVWEAVLESPVRLWSWFRSWTCLTPRSSTCPAGSVYRNTARVNNQTPVIHNSGIQWGFSGGATLTAQHLMTYNRTSVNVENKNCITVHEFWLFITADCWNAKPCLSSSGFDGVWFSGCIYSTPYLRI